MASCDFSPRAWQWPWGSISRRLSSNAKRQHDGVYRFSGVKSRADSAVSRLQSCNNALKERSSMLSRLVLGLLDIWTTMDATYFEDGFHE
eukprot:3913378-Pleurochrysis_carterae.AAC.1